MRFYFVNFCDIVSVLLLARFVYSEAVYNIHVFVKFLPRDVLFFRGIAMASRPSVRPSVCNLSQVNDLSVLPFTMAMLP